MVRTARLFRLFLPVVAPVLAAALSLPVAGCSVRSWWGEPSPPARSVEQSSSSSDPCPDPARILEGDDAQSSRALECLTQKVNSAWTDIQSAKPGTLSDADLETLIANRVLKVDMTASEVIRSSSAAKKLLGIRGDWSQSEVSGWLHWLREHRASLRESYQLLVGSRPGSVFNYAAFARGTELISSFLGKARWTLSNSELFESVTTLLPGINPQIRASLNPLLDVSLNMAGLLCPRLSDRSRWQAGALSECFSSVIAKFSGSAEFLEFYFDPAPAHPDLPRIRAALDDFADNAIEWLSQPGLTAVQPRLWIALGKSLDLDISEDSLENLTWVKHFDPSSTEKLLNPRFFAELVTLITDSQAQILDGWPVFAQCANRSPSVTWARCQPEPDVRELERSPALRAALNLRNLNYGARTVPLDGALFSKLMLFQSAAAKIVRAFDINRDGVIEVTRYDERNELLKALSVGLQFASDRQFFSAIVERLAGNRSADLMSKMKELETLDPAGLARLVALVGDTVVPRTARGNTKSLQLDEASVAGILGLIDSLGDYRNSFLKIVNGRDSTAQVARDRVIEALPRILEENFPRTYESCEKFGFELSCGIAFDEILPEAGSRDAILEPKQLDLITFTAVFVESLLDACEQNADGVLSPIFFEGSDELDCGFRKLKQTVDRLMDARLIEDSTTTRLILEFLDSNFITRFPGKVSLARGTTRLLLLRSMFPFGIRGATIGSILGLTSEVLNEKRSESVRHGLKARQKVRKSPNETGALPDQRGTTSAPRPR